MESEKALLYCNKAKPYLYKNTTVVGENIFTFAPFIPNESDIINGKIVAECDFEVEEIIANDVNLYDEYGIKYTTKNGYSCIDDNFEALLDDSCLNAFELNDYLGGYGGYAIYVKNIKVYDKPKDLSEYCKDISKVKNCWMKNNGSCNFGYSMKFPGKWVGCEKGRLSKAPSNMMYVFDGKGKKVFIPFRSEMLVKILNGECTIIVKKNVLKEMIK